MHPILLLRKQLSAWNCTKTSYLTGFSGAEECGGNRDAEQVKVLQDRDR